MDNIVIVLVLIGIVISIIYINYTSPKQQQSKCPLQEQDKNGECVELKQINEHMPISKVKVVPFVANIELYTDVLLNDYTNILPSNTPDDSSFNNKDVLQQHEKDRFSSLVFG